MKAKAIRVDGPFTEYYSPNFEDPYNTLDGYSEWVEDNIDHLKLPPVLYPCGQNEISSDLVCLADRATDCSCLYGDDHEKFMDLVVKALESGEAQKMTIDIQWKTLRDKLGKEEITITPVFELPKTDAKRFEQYGKWADDIRAAVEAV